MAEEKVVNLKINSNVSGTTDEVKQLNSELKKTEKEVDNVNDAGKGTSKLSAGFSKAGDAVDALQPGLKGAVSGMKAVLVQMWAIVANPIGLVVVAIVGAFTLLYKAFASTNEGADKLEQVMAGLSAVIDIVRDRILVVGNAIVKFFQGDFKGALAEGKKAVSGFGAEVEREFKQAANAAKALQEVEDAMRSISVSRAKLDRDLAKSKELLTDENATYQQKVKALKEIKEAEGKQTAQELANAQKKYDAIKLQNSLSDTSDDDLDKEAAAEAELYKIQQKSAEDNRSINKQEKRAHADELARIKAISEAKKQAAKQAADERKRLDEEANKRIQENAARLKEAADLEKAITEGSLANLKSQTTAEQAEIDIRKKADLDFAAWKINLLTTNADRERKIEEENAAKKKEIAQKEFEAKMMLMDATAAGLETLSGIIGQQTAAGKATAVAASLINTYAAIAGQLRAFAGVPIPGYAIVQAIATGLAGFAAVKNILKVQVPNGGGSARGSSSPSMTGISGGTQSSAPQFNVVGTSGVNQIAQVVSKEKPIVKAYVVASDVSTAQALDRNIIKNSTLG